MSTAPDGVRVLDAAIDPDGSIRPQRRARSRRAGNSPADTDPDLGNNTGQASFAIDCIVPIAINVRPANTFNRISVGRS